MISNNQNETSVEEKTNTQLTEEEIFVSNLILNFVFYSGKMEKCVLCAIFNTYLFKEVPTLIAFDKKFRQDGNDYLQKNWTIQKDFLENLIKKSRNSQKNNNNHNDKIDKDIAEIKDGIDKAFERVKNRWIKVFIQKSHKEEMNMSNHDRIELAIKREEFLKKSPFYLQNQSFFDQKTTL